MFTLPTELALAILSYIPIKQLGTLPLVCRQWQYFIEIHTNSIYHKAAVLHGYIRSSATSIEDVKQTCSSRLSGNAENWKDLCRNRYHIEKSWSGQASSTVNFHHSAGRFVHRIKVDEKAGYILTTTSIGGLDVTDLQDDRELWSLPDNHVRPYAHCEYGEGFLVFDYIDGSKEVWRRVDDFDEDEAASVVPESQPGERQRRISARAAEKYSTATADSTRGHFRIWAVLHPPQMTRAFRFSYPILGAAAWEEVYLWDVRTGALVQTIRHTQQNPAGEADHEMLLGDINYIEVSENKSVLDLSSSKHPIAAWNVSVSHFKPAPAIDGSSLVLENLIYQPAPVEQSSVMNEFIAVHISTCGSHMAALMLNSRLLIIRDFEKVFQRGVPVRELSVEVQLGSACHSSRYLAFENGRIGVVTKTGVFVVTPDLSPQDYTMRPRLSVFRVPVLGDRSCLRELSCLQMTDTGLFLNWDPDYLPDKSEERVSAMDADFYESVLNSPRTANLANGIQMTLVDLDEAVDDAESSSVVCVNFLST